MSRNVISFTSQLVWKFYPSQIITEYFICRIDANEKKLREKNIDVCLIRVSVHPELIGRTN